MITSIHSASLAACGGRVLVAMKLDGMRSETSQAFTKCVACQSAGGCEEEDGGPT